MLGTHATFPIHLKPVKLFGRPARIAAAILLLAALAGGLWWSVQSGLLDPWLSAAEPVTVASGDIIIQQAPAAATNQAAAAPAAFTVNADSAGVTASPVAAATSALTAGKATAEMTAAEKPVVIAGVAGVNGASLWDGAGNLVATLDSGALLHVKASADGGAWLLAATGSGEGWTPAADVIAYGLGRLATTLLPGVVAALDTPVVPAETVPVATTYAAPVSAAATSAAGSDAGAAAVTPANLAPAVLAATVAGAGSNLNIRSGPGVEYAVVAKAAEGTAWGATGRNAAGDWLLLQLSDDGAGTGWASAAYLQLDGDLQALPVVSPAQ